MEIQIKQKRGTLVMKNKIKMNGVYKLRRILPILGIAGASMFASCGGGDGKDEPEMPHNTVYLLNQINIYKLDTLQIARSADSVSVNKIIFRVDGTRWDGVTLRGVSNALECYFRNAKGKGMGEGTFDFVKDNETNRTYEPVVRSYGYDVIFRVWWPSSVSNMPQNQR